VKINPETRLLLILGAVVLLGGGGMVMLNNNPFSKPPPPIPTPKPLVWDEPTFESTLAKARHIRGDAKAARFTLIEFGDLECPSCRYAYNNLLVKVDKEFPIRFAFIHNPLAMHTHAIAAAAATEAADKQGKFWPMFDALYTNVDAPLNQDVFDATAKKLGLDEKRFQADCQDRAVQASVEQDSHIGIDVHISQTPTFVLRDEKSHQIYLVTGGRTLDQKISALTGTPTVMPPDPAK